MGHLLEGAVVGTRYGGGVLSRVLNAARSVLSRFGLLAYARRVRNHIARYSRYIPGTPRAAYRRMVADGERLVPGHSSMNIDVLLERSLEFQKKLEAIKGTVASKDFPWYPYGTLRNIVHLENLLTGEHRNLPELAGSGPVADVGAADGELAFFLESMGMEVDVVDYGPTNYNGLRGLALLKESMGSKVAIHEKNLDSYFEWPRRNYGLVFFLGILYHLKNPYYVLESLAKATRFALVSTRIAQYTPDMKTRIAEAPVGYLLHSTESNNDATNFWIFSDAGLKRILDRTGWDILDYVRIGNLTKSDPASLNGDERAFVLVKSRHLTAVAA